MTEIYPERQDWARVLDELNEAGYSTYRIAQILGHKWDTVKAWRSGEPKHSDGQALLKLLSTIRSGSTGNIPVS